MLPLPESLPRFSFERPRASLTLLTSPAFSYNVGTIERLGEPGDSMQVMSGSLGHSGLYLSVLTLVNWRGSTTHSRTWFVCCYQNTALTWLFQQFSSHVQPEKDRKLEIWYCTFYRETSKWTKSATPDPRFCFLLYKISQLYLLVFKKWTPYSLCY